MDLDPVAGPVPGTSLHDSETIRLLLVLAASPQADAEVPPLTPGSRMVVGCGKVECTLGESAYR